MLLLYSGSNKCRLGEQKTLFQNIRNLTVEKHLTGSVYNPGLTLDNAICSSAECDGLGCSSSDLSYHGPVCGWCCVLACSDRLHFYGEGKSIKGINEY